MIRLSDSKEINNLVWGISTTFQTDFPHAGYESFCMFQSMIKINCAQHGRTHTWQLRRGS